MGAATRTFDAAMREEPSTGAVTSTSQARTVAPPATGSHVELTAAERAALGIPETLVRYSCGIEHADDLIAEVNALSAGETLAEPEPEVIESEPKARRAPTDEETPPAKKQRRKKKISFV